MLLKIFEFILKCFMKKDPQTDPVKVEVPKLLKETDWEKLKFNESLPFDHIIIHHSATEDGRTFDWVSIKKYHVSYRKQGDIVAAPTNFYPEAPYGFAYTYDQKQVDQWLKAKKDGVSGLESPWKDIGYNLICETVNGIDQVFTGRLLSVSGAHCWQSNMNSRAIGILVVGDYDRRPIETNKFNLLIQLIEEVRDRYKKLKNITIPVKNVLGHREIPGVQKTCPGKFCDLVFLRSKLKDA
jgi:hypothetical protein